MKKEFKKISKKIDSNNGPLKFIPLYKAWTQKVGVNSDILLHHYYENQENKIVARFGVEKGGFNFEEGVEMMYDIIQYQKELRKYNIPLPKIEDIFLEYHPLGKRAFIVKISPWSGNDIEKVIERCHLKEDRRFIKMIVQKMCDIIKPLCLDRINKWETRVGIDPRCSNFTINGEGEIGFVDLFPPRYRKNNEPIIEWPEPKSLLGKRLGYFKHFDIRGIILCATAQLSKIKPEMKTILKLPNLIGEI